MVRIINMSNFAAFFVKFDQHEMTVVEVDGVYTVAQKTGLVYLSDAQRMSVLITAKPNANNNYAFVGAMDPSMFDSVPSSLNLNATGYLVYNTAKALPTQAPTFGSYSGGLDDFGLVPYDKLPLFGPVTRQVVLNVDSGVVDNQNRYLLLTPVAVRCCLAEMLYQVHDQQHNLRRAESTLTLHSLKRRKVRHEPYRLWSCRERASIKLLRRS